MINKQNIWFAFLFSIILILSIFYISMDNSELSEFVSNADTTDTTLVVNESTELVALRVQDDEDTLDTINELQNILLDQTSDVVAKNDAYAFSVKVSDDNGFDSAKSWVGNITGCIVNVLGSYPYARV